MQAVDLHKHDSDHDHGEGITIEEYSLKMLVVIAGMSTVILFCDNLAITSEMLKYFFC